MAYGYGGKIIKVDLTKKKIHTESSLKYGKAFIGGRGINIKILYDDTKPGVDAFSPENVLCIGTGPLAGTLCPQSGRHNVTTKSPLGFLGDSNSGGFWGPELKFAGYDTVAFYGKAEKPVYLWIDDDQVEIRDASHLWGRNTWETDKMIKEELGDPEIQIACIGQGGENLVRFACVINNLSRAAGKTGTGAVMGSKKLKAIAVRGTKGVQVAKPEKFLEVVEKVSNAIKESSAFPVYSYKGTMLYVESLYAIGMMALLNWKTIYWPPVAEIYAQKFWDRAWAKSKGCFSCSMHCSHFYSIRDGPFAGTYGEGPEYEAACAFAAKAGANNVDAVCYANNLVNQYGLDVIDAGNAISAAMEWFEKGIITEKDTGGIRIEWGDVDVIVKLIHMMAKREGFGDLLAEGAYFAAQKIGKNADYYVIQCKGLGYEACDRRGFKGSALSHGVATRGADHMRSSPALEFGGVPLKVKREQIADAFEKYVASRDLFQYAANPREYRGKPHLVKFYEHMYCVVDCLGLCKFGFSRWPDTNIYPEDHAALYSTATGIDVTWKELYQMAERVYNLERAFIVREGVTRAHDMPPERWVKEPTDAPWCKGEVIDLEKYNQMLDEYYELRGWDKNGVPTRKKLEELNLGYVADHMENLTIPRSTQFLTIGIKRE